MADLAVILLLGVHLWAVNVAGAGPMFSLWLGRRGHENDPVWDSMGRKLAWISLWALGLGMLTGGVQFVFLGSEGQWSAFSRFPDRAWWFAAGELAFSTVCLLLYAGCWQRLAGHRWWHASLALLSSTNLLYHFPPLMSVFGKLANDPTWARAEVIDRAALLQLMARSEILALTSHFVLASVVVAAVHVLWLASKLPAQAWEEAGKTLARRASWVAFVVTLCQLLVGIWLLVSLPSSVRSAMMGHSMLASLTFISSLLLTFVLLQRFLSAALGTAQPRELRFTCCLLAALVLLMTATLYSSRTEHTVPKTVSVNKKQPWSEVLHGC